MVSLVKSTLDCKGGLQSRRPAMRIPFPYVRWKPRSADQQSLPRALLALGRGDRHLLGRRPVIAPTDGAARRAGGPRRLRGNRAHPRQHHYFLSMSNLKVVSICHPAILSSCAFANASFASKFLPRALRAWPLLFQALTCSG